MLVFNISLITSSSTNLRKCSSTICERSSEGVQLIVNCTGSFLFHFPTCIPVPCIGFSVSGSNKYDSSYTTASKSEIDFPTRVHVFLSIASLCVVVSLVLPDVVPRLFIWYDCITSEHGIPTAWHAARWNSISNSGIAPGPSTRSSGRIPWFFGSIKMWALAGKLACWSCSRTTQARDSVVSANVSSYKVSNCELAMLALSTAPSSAS